MRDYDNMPVLNWNEDKSPQKAQAQILRQEPVILQMSDGFDTPFDGDEFGCRLQEDSGILYDCDGGAVLNHLAEHNGLSGLSLVAEACIESSSQVDIDSKHHRIIVHD